MLVAGSSADRVVFAKHLLAARVGEPETHAWVRRRSGINAADVALAAQWRKISFDHARCVAVKRETILVGVREPFVSWARDVRLARINRSIRRRRGTTTSNQHQRDQHVTHHAIVHANADTCAAIGKAVQL